MWAPFSPKLYALIALIFACNASAAPVSSVMRERSFDSEPPESHVYARGRDSDNYLSRRRPVTNIHLPGGDTVRLPAGFSGSIRLTTTNTTTRPSSYQPPPPGPPRRSTTLGGNRRLEEEILRGTRYVSSNAPPGPPRRSTTLEGNGRYDEISRGTPYVSSNAPPGGSRPQYAGPPPGPNRYSRPISPPPLSRTRTEPAGPPRSESRYSTPYSPGSDYSDDFRSDASFPPPYRQNSYRNASPPGRAPQRSNTASFVSDTGGELSDSGGEHGRPQRDDSRSASPESMERLLRPFRGRMPYVPSPPPAVTPPRVPSPPPAA